MFHFSLCKTVLRHIVMCLVGCVSNLQHSCFFFVNAPESISQSGLLCPSLIIYGFLFKLHVEHKLFMNKNCCFTISSCISVQTSIAHAWRQSLVGFVVVVVYQASALFVRTNDITSESEGASGVAVRRGIVSRRMDPRFTGASTTTGDMAEGRSETEERGRWGSRMEDDGASVVRCRAKFCRTIHAKRQFSTLPRSMQPRHGPTFPSCRQHWQLLAPCHCSQRSTRKEQVRCR